MSSLKLYKLTQHQKSQPKQYALEDVAFCPKDFPFLEADDLIEIYNPEDELPRLILKVTKGSLRDEFSQKDSISVEQSIANAFQLKSFSDVVVNKIEDSRTVELDSVELTFKDQYLGRSEMWRLKSDLVDTCLYLSKKLEFCSSTIRCQVYEMWSHGDKVSSGIVSNLTKIVFRSSTSMVYLFIQMSSEMWEFDIYGDLYYEKAVNGFLAELFAKWKKHGCNHEVTIVLFSRIHYDASSLEQFPESMRDCLQTDYKNRFYEDYYRVAVQNEKYEDWGNTLIHLRRLFVDYQNNVLSMHRKDNPGHRIPKAVISSAAQGNFLEVLNMSLNVFEKHYMDRSFDRTGQLSVVITPGVGVFEVDREVTNVTMQRIIDNGVGSDLVCVGEQPLHAVPLLKFHSKVTSQSSGEDYSMPHWINLSFYSTNRKVGYSSYVPRIKLPISSAQENIPKHKSWSWTTPTQYRIPRPKQGNDENFWPNSVYDFDDYDCNVFKLPNSHQITHHHHRRSLQRKKPRPSDREVTPVFRRQNSEPEIQSHHNPDITQNNDLRNLSLTSTGSSDRSNLALSLSSSASQAITIPAKQKIARMEQFVSSSFGALNIETKPKLATSHRENWFYDDLLVNTHHQKLMSPGSQGGSPINDKKTVYSRQQKEIRRPCRALINPFDPSHAVIKLTSNRRRWTHIFPRGPSGILIQQHHYHAGHSNLEIVHEGADHNESILSPSKSIAESKSRTNRNSMTRQTLLWGATGEQGWSPALTTGVDWKSLTIPACLPITTDYFPDERSLQNEFTLSDYSLLPDDVNADYAQQRAVYRTPLTTKQVFLEIVSQRLAQGFQLIIRPKDEKDKNAPINSSFISRTNIVQDDTEEYLLSIGRIFHRITLCGSTITVTRYRPRHPYPSIKIHYRYRFLAPNNHNYEVSWADFATEKLENYNWNYLDHYICTRGDQDFALVETLKYWRFRMFLLPTFQAPVKKILEGAPHTNVYAPLNDEEKAALVDGFLKFIETCINRIRRPNNSAKIGVGGRAQSTAQNQNQASSTGFRERVGSNRLGERPRPRSGSKGMEKWTGRTEGSGTAGTASPDNLSLVDNKSSLGLNEFNLDGMSPSFGSENMEADAAVLQFKLKSTTTHRGIIEAMCSQNTGFSFIKSADLPAWTFVSADATSWLMNHMEGITNEIDAIAIFNEMLEERLILHASRDQKHQFVYGFYLYFIVSNSTENKDGEFRDDLNLFRNDWMEVEVELNRRDSSSTSSPDSPMSDSVNRSSKSPTSSSLSKDSEGEISAPTRLNSTTPAARKIPAYKEVYVDVDVGSKNPQVTQWGHVLYQSVYKPTEAFEMTIQWVQATGSIITELVQGWARKAQQCNLVLVSIPSDPYALPYSSKSDSLRGPIFIPLNVECLMESRSYLFEEFPEETWTKRMVMLQESIIFQFGFMPSPSDPQSHNTGNTSKSMPLSVSCTLKKCHHHYVHSSGNMFLLIPAASTTNQGVSIKDSPKCLPHDSPTTSSYSSYEDYITRHVSGKNKDALHEDHRVGFLWSWNYMVSKRWKTSSTPALGDETFLFAVLRDFQAFCANEGNRLKTYWHEYRSTNSI